MGKHMLVVFTNPVEGQEDEYNRWYSEQHIKDVVAVPGFRAAERFKTQVRMTGELNHGYVALYEMDADTLQEAEATMGRLSNTEMPISDALNRTDVAVGIFEAWSPVVTPPNAKPEGTYRFIAMTDALDGREAEYSEWYNTVHLQDVSSVPGFTSGRRFKLQKTVSGAFKNNYLALFGLEASTPEAHGAALQSLGGAQMAKTDSGRSATAIAATFQSCSEKVSSPHEKATA